MRKLVQMEPEILDVLLQDPDSIMRKGKPFISVNTLIQILDKVIPILERQATIRYLPENFRDVVIVGDLHGDYNSLLRITTKFIRGDINSFVFLGDYVDRGKDQLFVLVYLISLFLHFPDRIQLQKGNHESIKMNQRFGFFEELHIHYPDQQDFERVIQKLDELYNVLTVASITPDGSFLVHGGIPKSISNIEEVVEIPKPYTKIADLDHEKKDLYRKCLLELQWNDPDETQSDKFVPSWRGKGIYLFNHEAVDQFLKDSSLNRVIRAHESSRGGYQSLFEDKLLHVFSSEPYFGKVKKAAVIRETTNTRQVFDLDLKPW